MLGVLLRLFLSARIGSEGMGLYQLIMSVYGLFSTFATAGFTVAVSRLVAEKSERSVFAANKVYKMSIAVAGIISVFFTVVMFLSADYSAKVLLGDARTALPLRILALSMPFMALSACMKGYFMAKRQVIKTASASLSEQIVKIAVIAAFLNLYMAGTNDIGKLCTGIVAGITLGEIFSFFYLWLFRFFETKKQISPPGDGGSGRRGYVKALLSVILPISASVYVTSLLHTAENIMLPRMLERYSGDRSAALSQFGMIRGMVIPILFFPFAFLTSLVSILIPEISRLNVKEDKRERNEKISKIMSLTFVFSTAAGGLFYFLAGEIGETFYPGENTLRAIQVLALVTPFMYIETIADGLLKGIGEQLFTLRVSIYNSAVRLAIIFSAIPATGSEGYLWLLVGSNTFAFAMCISRLKKVTAFRFDFTKNALCPFAAAIAGGLAGRFVIDRYIPVQNWISASAGTVAFIIIFALIYILFAGRGRLRQRV